MKLVQLLMILPIILAVSCSDKKEKTLNVAVSSLPETFDPLIRNEYFTNLTTRSFFDPLIETADTGYSPVLADGWVNLSANSIQFRLKDNVVFHNGDLLTTKDISASLERATKHPKSLLLSEPASDKFSLTVIDDLSFQIHYTCTTDVLMKYLTFVDIFSASVLTQFSDTELEKNPVGTGEYLLDSYNDKLVTLKRFEKYWGKKPEIKNINIIKIPTKDEQIRKALSGEVDFLLDVPLNSINHITSSNKLNIINRAGNSVLYMMLDAKRENTPYIDKTPNPLLNKNVRKAIWHAIDIETFVTRNLGDAAQVITQPSIPDNKGYNHLFPKPEFSVQYAKYLLREAGYENGFSMTIDCIKEKYPLDQEIGLFITTSLEEIGISAEIRYLPSDEFYNKIIKKDASVYVTGYRLYDYNNFTAIYGLYNADEKKGILNRFNNYDKQLQDFFVAHPELELLGDENIDTVINLSALATSTYFVIPLYAPYDIFALSNQFTWSPSTKNILFSEFKIRK